MKNKILIGIVIGILIAGAIVIAVAGLNFDINYSRVNEIELHLNKEFNIKDIEQIAKEVLGNNISVKAVELYNDAVSITAKEITKEKRNELVEKVNEKYEIEINSENMEINTIANIRGRDIVKNIILPFVISTAFVLIYMIIKYFRLGFGKVLLKTILTLVITQAELLSLIAIFRIPVGRITVAQVLFVYMFTLIVLTSKFEQKLQEVKAQEDNE